MKRVGAILAVTVAATAFGTSGQAATGEEWVREPFPPRPDAISVLNGVSTGGETTWAVGGLYTPPGAPSNVRTQVFRRGEGDWQAVPAPDIGDLIGSAATSPKDAWAVSEFTKFHHGSSIHWDGKDWTEVPVTVSGATRVSPSDITAVGPDVWTVGTAYVDGDEPKSFGFTKQWNGAGWRDVPLPSAASGFNLVALDGAASDDMWTVGVTGADTPQLAALHWDGTAWSQVPVPPVEGADAGVTANDVAAFAPDDVWISAMVNGDYSPVLMHWDGSAWTQVDAPETGAIGEFVNAEGALWNLGQNILRYDGTSWQPVSGPPEGSPHAGAALADDRLLAVGSTGDIASQPIVTVHNG